MLGFRSWWYRLVPSYTVTVISTWLLNSAQSSQSTTPVHEPRDGRSGSGRFYVTTPDLLSSDTDVTSPENHASAARNAENGTPRCVTKPPDDERAPDINPHYNPSEAVIPGHVAASKPQYQDYSTSHAVPEHRPPPVQRSSSRDASDHQDESRPVDRGPTGFRFRAGDQTTDHQRDSSPINRLAGLFKNLAKF